MVTRYLILLLVLVSCASNKEAADKTPEEKKFDLYYSYGTDSLIMKDYSSAVEYLRKAEEIKESDSKLQNNLGMAYYFKNHIEMATKHLKRSIELDNKNSDAKNNLAGIYYQQNNLSPAKVLYLQVLNDLIYKFQFRTNYNLGLISLKERDQSAALEYFARSVKENEDYCPAHYQSGEVHYRNMRYAEALNHFIKATAGTCVSSPAPHYRQAQTLLKLNRHADALFKLNMIIEKFPNTSFALMAQNRLREINISDAELKQNKDRGIQGNKVNIDDDPEKILESVKF